MPQTSQHPAPENIIIQRFGSDNLTEHMKSEGHFTSRWVIFLFFTVSNHDTGSVE
jgi:hypothetical protein